MTRPAPFAYASPTSLQEALRLLAGGEARAIAGGQSLTGLMNLRLATPEMLIDLGQLQELSAIELGDDGSLRMGAMVTQAHAARHPAVLHAHPLLADAIRLIGHPQIRNRGTVGGSVAHADPASELPAVAVALDAMLELASERGVRRVAAADFFEGPYMTALQPVELLTSLTFPPAPKPGGRHHVIDEMTRCVGAFAIAGVIAVVDTDGGRCVDARIVTFGAGPKPRRYSEAERSLIGGTLDADEITAAAKLASASAQPSDDLQATAAQRRRMVRALTERSLAKISEAIR